MVHISLRERLNRETLRRGEGPDLAKKLHEIAKRCASLPVLDTQSEDEILGYDENGLPSCGGDSSLTDMKSAV